EDLAIGQRLGEAAALARFEGQPARRARRESEQRVGPPPGVDLAGEGLEGTLRRRGDAQGDDDARRHAWRSRWALKAASCSAQSRSVSSSQALRWAIGSGLRA